MIVKDATNNNNIIIIIIMLKMISLKIVANLTYNKRSISNGFYRTYDKTCNNERYSSLQ